MTHLNLGRMSRSDLDAHIRATESPNSRPLPEFAELTGDLDQPPTAAEIAAHDRRITARADRRAAYAEPHHRFPGLLRRPVAALRRVLVERSRRREAPEEGVGVGAA